MYGFGSDGPGPFLWAEVEKMSRKSGEKWLEKKRKRKEKRYNSSRQARGKFYSSILWNVRRICTGSPPVLMKYNIFIFRLPQEIVQKKTNVSLYRILCLVGCSKRIHIPTPVSVKEHTKSNKLKRFLLGGSLSYSHYSVDEN